MGKMLWIQVRPIIFLLTFATLSVSLAACSILGSSSGGRLGTQVELAAEQQAWLTCSDSCSARAQCGFAIEGEGQTPFVFVDARGPRTADHTNYVNDGAPVSVRERRMVTLVREADGTQLDVPFYRIDTGLNYEAWVAGWCISDNAPGG
jgi:hypothetical protein